MMVLAGLPFRRQNAQRTMKRIASGAAIPKAATPTAVKAPPSSSAGACSSGEGLSSAPELEYASK